MYNLQDRSVGMRVCVCVFVCVGVREAGRESAGESVIDYTSVSMV